MEGSIITLLHQLAELGFSPLNIVLIVMLYFMGAHSGIFPNFWKRSEDVDEVKEPTLRDLHQQVVKLQGYFNHDTTQHLDTIKATQEKTLELAKEIRAKHEEYDRFGIRVRNSS